ncbi:hypothetical protein ASPZODRAFT_69921 [Penicilliopsis zonata CBS 506.65]|uniref:Cytochrome P450 alkane hydroxylase n=1 Tax=Penicilliopsis zonata CBS 506.65 TaxID=1073090 RepID=A0A1L9SDV0_9EURO|nr:hypothetical protein ASPZODRAFT_69921 [Penicilliopsis zonata CBS 506.65]OJJ45390.1 hypothetical protein ASPZODRAFT_69921 [Penicilliopsis zonata CBS 506.65]
MIEDLLRHAASTDTAVWVVGLLILAFWLRRWQVDAQIARLGGRACAVQTRLPYAIDFIYKATVANLENRDLEFWDGAIMNARGASRIANPKTAELSSGMSNRVIVTKDPENIKALLTAQFEDYGKGESFHRDWKEFLGDGIFVTDGEPWARSRHLLRPMFVRERIVDITIFEKHVQELLPLLAGQGLTSHAPDSSPAVDVVPLLYRYALDAATDYLLGQGTDSLVNPKAEFAEAFRYVQQRQAEIFRMGMFNGLLSRKRFRRELRTMDNFVQPYIDKVLSLSPEELDRKLQKRETFLDALARFTRDPRVLRDQMYTVLLAGRDTTATTLSFCLFELSRNPAVVAQLRSEISSRLGVGARATPPNYTDLKEMKFLTAVLNETLRLYPVVPFNVRNSLRDTTLPRGGGADGQSPIGVRRETRIIFSTIFMQRASEYYDGPGTPKYLDPQQWLPERWVSGWQPKPWHFIPFNGGPRICIGQQFAMLEMGYTLVRILQEFEQILPRPPGGKDKVEDPVLRFDIVLSPGSELNCVFVKH